MIPFQQVTQFPNLGSGFQRRIFPKIRNQLFRILFLILFSFLRINKNKWQLQFYKKKSKFH